MKWIDVEKELPPDGERVWILNEERHPDFRCVDSEYKVVKSLYIYDGFFERCAGWVLLQDCPEKRVRFWGKKDLPNTYESGY